MRDLEDRRERTINTSRLLVVEGNDERNFFRGLAQHLSIGDIGIEDYGGKDKLRMYLPALVTRTGFRAVHSLGIVRDANGSGRSAFQSVQGCLRNADLPVPSEPSRPFEALDRQSRGWERLTVSVFILPDCRNPGTLETLLYRTLEQEVVECISEFLKCAQNAGGHRPKNEHKARIFAYLATGERPRHSVGVAGKQGVWDFRHAAFRHIGAFLRGM